jgi:hypothetical protein
MDLCLIIAGLPINTVGEKGEWSMARTEKRDPLLILDSPLTILYALFTILPSLFSVFSVGSVVN